MKKWKITLILEVSNNWIKDGFDASERLEQIEELVSTLLPSAYEEEFKVKAKVTTAPDPKVLAEMMGYSVR